MSWPHRRLETLAATEPYSFVGGPFGSKLTSRDYVAEGVPVIRGSNLNGSRFLYMDDFVFVSDSKVREDLSGNLAKAGDLVFTQRGTLGQVAIIPEDGIANRYVVSQSQMKITLDENKSDKFFLYYYFSSRKTVEKILNLVSSSGVPHINLTVLRNFEVPVPSLDTQKRIASVLSAYDDLTENNRRRIRLLEQAARLLYKEWFIHLRFPGHEHVKIKDGVPEGWEKKTLGDLVEVTKGRNITKNSAKDGSVPVVAGGLSPAYYHDTANAVGPVITISASGANAGYVNLYYEDIWASDCSYISSTSTDRLYYLYSLLKSKQREIFGFQKGAAQPHVYPKDLKRLPLLVPKDIIVSMFEESVADNFRQVKVLAEQNKLLVQARDLLLPRLMSGNISSIT